MAARSKKQWTKRPDRQRSGTVGPAVIYGLHAVAAALRNPARRIAEVYVTPNAREVLSSALAVQDIEAIDARPAQISAKAPDGAVHQGALLLADPLPPVDLAGMELNGPVLVLDRVTDPHNVGAILRTAAAFNVSCLVTTKLFSPEATGVLAKAASGGLEHVPWARETNLSSALGVLKDRGFEVIGLEGAAETALCPVDDPARLALVLGSEGKGLRAKTARTCDRLARIPLPGAVTSLNVSNAAAIALTIATGLGSN